MQKLIIFEFFYEFHFKKGLNFKMDDLKNRKHIENVYKNKTINLLKICIGLSILSFATYLSAIFFYNAFDFGLIFEIISFIFIIFAINKTLKNDFQSGKRNIIIAIIPIGWLIIYDFFNLCVNIVEVMTEVSGYYLSFDKYFYYIEPYLFDVILIAMIILLYKSYRSLNRVTSNSQSDNYTDTFYDEL